MKNNELKDLKPVYTQEAKYTSTDEINLIDLALVLLRRQKLIMFTFLLFLLLGVATAMLIPKKYTYSTSIEIGSQIIDGKVISFESPETLLAKMQHSFIPRVLNQHKSTTQDEQKKYKIKVQLPKKSEIIVVELKGTEGQKNIISSLLRSLTTEAINNHNRIYESVKQNLNSRLVSLQTRLDILGKDGSNLAEKTSLESNIESLASQLANLRNTREILPPMQSIEPTGVSKRLIVIIAAFLGAFVAIFAALFAEFATKVKQRSLEPHT